jgi:hypothetical protein
VIGEGGQASFVALRSLRDQWTSLRARAEIAASSNHDLTTLFQRLTKKTSQAHCSTEPFLAHASGTPRSSETVGTRRLSVGLLAQLVQ